MTIILTNGESNNVDEAPREDEPCKSALRQFLSEIDAKYPCGWYVAIENGHVLAASADFQELVDMLIAQGRNPPDTIVIEAGAKGPEYVTIL
jgi:hypothetical protein